MAQSIPARKGKGSQSSDRGKTSGFSVLISNYHLKFYAYIWQCESNETKWLRQMYAEQQLQQSNRTKVTLIVNQPTLFTKQTAVK